MIAVKQFISMKIRVHARIWEHKKTLLCPVNVVDGFLEEETLELEVEQ